MYIAMYVHMYVYVSIANVQYIIVTASPIAVPSSVITGIMISVDDTLERSIENTTDPWSSLIVIDVSLKHMMVTKIRICKRKLFYPV